MAIPLPELAGELEVRLEGMGYELVEATWAGSRRRPILRVRMDLPDSIPGETGVTVDQCAEVSRALEPWLDAHGEIPERYVLEVSSPGVDRPLVRRKDWSRFRGQTVTVKGKEVLARDQYRLEGELLGLDEEAGNGSFVLLRLEDGSEIRIPLDRVEKANLVFKWE
jgi:ribosome maturation factor RimP